MQTAIFILGFAFLISLVWALSLWYTNKILMDFINDRDEPTEENPNQLKLNFEEDEQEDNH